MGNKLQLVCNMHPLHLLACSCVSGICNCRLCISFDWFGSGSSALVWSWLCPSVTYNFFSTVWWNCAILCSNCSPPWKYGCKFRWNSNVAVGSSETETWILVSTSVASWEPCCTCLGSVSLARHSAVLQSTATYLFGLSKWSIHLASFVQAVGTNGKLSDIFSPFSERLFGQRSCEVWLVHGHVTVWSPLTQRQAPRCKSCPSPSFSGVLVPTKTWQVFSSGALTPA